MAILNGVLIGAGYFAGFHAEAWSRIGSARINAVADPVPGRAAEFARRWQIPRAYTDPEEMIAREKPEFVDIAARPEWHLSLANLAARAGAHVICQKPMAPTWPECQAMTQICQNQNVRLIIHENWRWQPWFREIHRLLKSGLLGEVFHIGFQMRTGDGRGEAPYPVQSYFRDMSMFVVYEVAVHFFDTFRFLLGEVDWVFCHTRRINPVIQGEDYAVVQLGFRNRAHGLIDANRISGPVPPELTLGLFRLEGERGMIRLSPDGRLWITEYGQDEREHCYSWNPTGYKGDSVRAFQADAIDALQTGRACDTEANQYLNSVAVVFASYESAQTGMRVPMADWLRRAGGPQRTVVA